MDPGQRKVLEVAYEAFENAGMPMEKIKGSRTAVYIGAGVSDYEGSIRRDPEYVPKYTFTGTCHEILANRISHYFDIHGPSIVVETACSSSLVAIHLACQSVRSGEASMAIAGGVHLILKPEITIQLSNLGFLSSSGHCRSFDDSGDGFARGEGCGIIVIKKLVDAERNGDSIRAIIRGSGVNSDGWTQGITLPNTKAQAALIKDVYETNGLDMDSTQFVECHGTGTKVGDPAEIDAIHETLGRNASPFRRLLVGSVKPNIGHLEYGSAVAGLIKGVLAMEHGMIPPQIYLDKLNASIPFEEWNIEVPRKLTPWPAADVKRMSVSSFGMGGTNAHVVLEGNHKRKAIPLYTGINTNGDLIPKRLALDKKRLYTLSAFDQAGLERVAKNLAEHLDSLGPAAFASENMANLAYTLGEHRSKLPWKTTVLAENGPELCAKLDCLKIDIAVRSTGEPRIGFVFTGQGAQWPGMGVELLERKVFRESVAKSAQYLQDLCCEWDPTEELRRPSTESRLGQPQISQPICTVLQIALVDELESWGIVPVKCIGHSSGEIGAAYAVGALSHKDAVAAAYFRGKVSSLIKEMHIGLNGGMMAVGLGRNEAEEWIAKVDSGTICVACVNSPQSVTISGDVSGINQLLLMLEAKMIFARKLKVEVAYHSHHMSEVVSDYLATVSDIEGRRPVKETAQMISSVTGGLVDPEELGAYYWARNLISPVEFADALIELVTGGIPTNDGNSANTVDMLIEVGPHSALSGPIQQTLNAGDIKGVVYASVLERGKDSMDLAFDLAANLFTKGAALNIQGVNEDVDSKALIDLPPYPWNHTNTFHAESRMEIQNSKRKQPRKSLIGVPMPMMDENEHVWRGFLSLEEEPWIRDHKGLSTILLPASGMCSMVFEAAQQIADPGKRIRAFKLRDVAFVAAMAMSEDTPTEVIVHIRPHIISTAAPIPHTWWEFTITSCKGHDQVLLENCRGLMMIDYVDDSKQMKSELAYITEQHVAEYKQVLEACPDTFDKFAFYETAQQHSWFYGPLFQNIDKMHHGHEKCAYDVSVKDCGPSYSNELVERPYLIHPAVLDAVFQSWALGAYIMDKQLGIGKATVPTSVGEFEIAVDVPAEIGTCFKGYCTTERQGFKNTAADVYWLDENLSKLYLSVRDFRCTEVAFTSAEASENGKRTDTSDLCTAILWDYSLDLLRPEEMKAILANTSPMEVTRNIARMFLHTNPSATVLELLPDSDSSKAAMSTILDAATFPGQVRYVTAQPQGEAATEVSYLSGVESPIASEAVADLIVVSPECESMVDLNKTLDKVLCFAKPTATVICTTDDESVEPILSGKGYVSSVTSAMYNQPVGVLSDDVAGKLEVVIIETPTAGDRSRKLALQLNENLTNDNHDVKVATWDERIVTTIENKVVISLLEIERGFLDSLSEIDFTSLRGIIFNAKRLLWLTYGDDPVYNMIDGLARVVRGEFANTRFDVLHLSKATGLDHGASLAGRILIANSRDAEFRESNGAIKVSRISLDHEQNKAIDRHLNDWTVIMPLREHNGPLRLTIGRPGLLDTLHLIPDDRWDGKPLSEHEVEIEVKASGLNFRDVMSSMGILNDAVLGLELGGVVKSVGCKVTRVKVGDRVAACGRGTHATLLRTNEVFCAQIPDYMAFETAAALSVVHTTAYHALVNLAKLRKGQSILIHAAAGGVGQAAIQLSKYLGLVIYATVGSAEKKKLLVEKYGVHPEHIFSSRDTTFVHGIKRVTNSRGVDCILNSLSGELLRQSWYCLSKFGTFIEIGLRIILGNTRLDMKPFMQNATFTFFNLMLVMEQKPDEYGQVFATVHDLVRQNILTAPHSLTTYPLGAVERAFRLIQSGKHLGKLVFVINENHEAPVLQKASASLKLDPKATYLLVGGLGGLGRSLAGMFIDSGACTIAFISRSGDSGTEAKKTISELAARPAVSIKVYTADIADMRSFEQAMTKCEAECPPIKGVVQMAMVLRDALFEKMTFDDWAISLRPKVHGTRNLHEYFTTTRPLDFMILASSCAGVFGNSGQANYAAGNTYLDGLAHYRRSRGLKAVSVDLGIIRDVGVVAETGAKGFLGTWEKAIGIREPVFHAMIRFIINGQTGLGANLFPAQVSAGLPTADIMLEYNLPRPHFFDDPRMAHLAIATALSDGAIGTKGISGSVESRLEAAETIDAATNIIREALVQKMAGMFQMVASDVDTTKPLYMYGVDSLVAVEMKNWILREMKANIPLLEVLAAIPIENLAANIADRSKLVVVN